MASSGYSTRQQIRVAVVDDDEINRRGMATLLSEAPRVEVVAAVSHMEALRNEIDWSMADVVLVDAADQRHHLDQFPGVSVVEKIRRESASGVTVIAVTEFFFDDAIRRRMSEARADVFCHRAQLVTADALINLVLHCDGMRAAPVQLDPEALFRYGVTDFSKVNRGVAFAAEHRMMDMLESRPDPRSRFWLRLRRDFNREARLSPVTTDGRRPDRAQDIPSLPQIARFLSWATKIKTVRADTLVHATEAPLGAGSRL